MKRRGTTQLVGRKTKRLYGRFWLRHDRRESIPIPGVDKDDARAVAERCDLIADMAEQLVSAGRDGHARPLAIQLGAAKTPKQITAVLAAARILIDSARVMGDGITVRQFGDRWTSGDLAKTFPRHVKRKATASDDEQILARYVYPLIGSMALRSVQLEDGERVLDALPSKLSPARVRHVAQAMHRLLTLAIYPAKVIKAHPFPKNFLPKLGPPKAKQCLYPDEDAKLMACTKIPIVWRLFYGVIDREGFRFTEARMLDWDDLDLDRGAVRLDKNKTDDPRAWALDPGVKMALRRWRQLRPEIARPFDEIPTDEHQAERFRDDVKMAGVDRPVLFETTSESLRLVFHDLRAIFVTVSLANGKSETWVSDRTGHKSSTMIAKYRRAARTYAELGLGPLMSLADAIVWDETEACQTHVKASGGGVGAGARRLRGKRLSTEGGTRTLTPVRAADFESDSTSSNDTKRGKKRPIAYKPPPAIEAFDRRLTDHLANRRQWSAYEIAIESMADVDAEGQS